jgi:hypothetical protein
VPLRLMQLSPRSSHCMLGTERNAMQVLCKHRSSTHGSRAPCHEHRAPCYKHAVGKLMEHA